MANFTTARKKVQKLTPRKGSKDLFDFIRTIEEELAAYNRATIFEESEDVNKKAIGFYSKASELISNGKKKAGEPFDLKDTGDFLEGIFAKVQSNSIFFDTTDKKKKEVFKNLLTENIFGLQDEDLKKVIDTRLLPFFIKYYRSYLT